MNAVIANRNLPAARRIGWGAAVVLLAAPAVAMLFTREVNWGAEDFATLAVMLGIAGLCAEAGVRTVRKPLLRAVLMGAIALAFLLVWAELAVGIIPG